MAIPLVVVVAAVEVLFNFKLGRGGGRGGSNVFSAPHMDMRLVVPKSLENVPEGLIEKVEVTINPVAKINLHELLAYSRGEPYKHEVALHASNALSVFLRHIPSIVFTPVGANVILFNLVLHS